MRKRKKISKKRSKSLFSKTASRTNKKNITHNPMRGGIRM